MAKIDDSVKKKVPELRFPGFTDDWEERKLGNELTLLKDGTHGTHQNVLEGPLLLSAKNIKNGKIIIDEITDRKISVEEYNSIHKKFSLEKGDVLLTIVGSIGETAIIENPIGITFQRSVAYLRPSHTILSQFLFTTINGQKFQMELRKRQVVSAQPGIYLGDLSIIPILIPSVAEQETIGSFFKQLDETIALHQRKLDLLKEQKKGYLQKMFPKNGAKVPELRFGGFADDWEERKLSNESTITAGGDIDKSKLKEVGEYPIFANALTNDGTVGYYDSYYRVEAPAVTVTGRGDVGHAKARKVNFTPVVRLLAVKSNHDVDFLENAINNHKVLVESTGVPQLTAPQLGNYKIFFPTGEEQQKIGSFFKQLDKTIALHQRKLDLLKEQKKGFLQKMFV